MEFTQNTDFLLQINENDLEVLRVFGNKVLQCNSIEEMSAILFDLIENNIKVQVSSLFLLLKNREIERVSIQGKDIQGLPIDKSWLEENGKREHYEPGVSFSGKVLDPEKDSVYGKPILSNNIKKDYHPLKYCDRYEEKIGPLRNGISVPLNGTHRTFGTIEIINKVDGDFTQKDLCWLTIVGAHVSATISRLRKNKEEEVIKYLISILASNQYASKSIDKISQTVADLLVGEDLMPYKFCTFRFIDNEGEGLLAIATSSHLDTISVQNKKHSNRRINQGLVGKVYRTKEPIEINKISENVKLFVSRKWIMDSNLKSFFCYPLIYQGQAIGTMSIFTGYEHELHDQDRKFLQEVSLLVASCHSAIDDSDRFKNLKSLVDLIINYLPLLGSTKKDIFHKVGQSIQEIKDIIIKRKCLAQNFYDFPYKAESALLNEFRTNGSIDSKILLPMLLKVKNINWESQNIPDYKEIYRSPGDGIWIIACKGSYKTVEALNNELDVISISADHIMISDERCKEGLQIH